LVKSEILRVTPVVFWNVTSCRLVDIYGLSDELTASIVGVIALMMEAERSSETSVYYQITQ
jgi:hypothetical protein